jgi:hypothetical protein
MSKKTAKDAPAETLERVQGLVDRAVKGDRTVLPELGQMLDRHPEMWQACGDLAVQAAEAWLKMTAGDDLLVLESARRKSKELLEQVAGENPSRLERLLAERVAATWLQVNYADMVYAHNNRPGTSLALMRSLMERQESAQRSHLAAVKQLALVRKLLKPALSPLELLSRPSPDTRAPGRTFKVLRSDDVLAGVGIAN